MPTRRQQQVAVFMCEKAIREGENQANHRWLSGSLCRDCLVSDESLHERLTM